MRWYIVPLTYLVIGLYNVYGCVENHVQCLKSFQWKYRAFRTFHHISNAETCQAACSRYSSRLNYFSFDVSIHRCICLANCLIHRGDEAQNDVTGTVSDVDPSELCQVPENQDTQGQQVQEDLLKLIFFDDKRIFSFNSQTKELRTITSLEEKYLTIKAVTKVKDKLFSMVTEDQSPDGREQRAFILAKKIDKDTLNLTEVPYPSDHLKFSTKSHMVRLSDGRIWIYYYSKPYSVLFDGDTFLPFMEPIWTNNGYSLMKPSMARVFEDNIVVVGGVLFHFKSSSASMSRATKVFILDMKKNESRAVEDIPGDFLLFPSIWPVVVDGQRKVFIAKGTNLRRKPNQKLYILDWKTEKFSVLENSAPYFPTPDGGYQFKGMSMLGQEPYYLQGNASGVGIYNLQDLADGQSGDTKTIYIPGATNVHDLQLADVDDWLED